jgi:hypothetical protein
MSRPNLQKAAFSLRAALTLCVEFIENVSDDDPDREDKFFAVRAAWREAYSVADEVGITLEATDTFFGVKRPDPTPAPKRSGRRPRSQSLESTHVESCIE